jgi:hypothetical protein
MPNPKPATPNRPLGALYIALGIIAILVSVLFFMTFAISRSHTMRFQYEGREAPAQIEALNWSTTRTLYVTYKFIDDFGAEHHSVDAYPLADADELKAGQTLDIIYLVGLPDKSRIAAHQDVLMKDQKKMPWDLVGYIAAGGMFSITVGVLRREREARARG